MPGLLASVAPAAPTGLSGDAAAYVAGGFVAFVFVYGISLLRRPFTRCRACGGASRFRGKLFTYAWGPCRTCGGSGRKYRLGRRLFFGDDKY